MKHYDRLKQLLDEELNKNGYNYKIIKFDVYQKPEYHETYCLVIKDGFGNERRLEFLLTDEYIKVSMNGDGNSFYQIKNKDYSIKYFWIALLS